MNNRTEWLKERQQGIGGSEVAAVLGLSKWSTPFDVWLEKTSPIENAPPNLAMQLGTFLESFVVEKYREETGNQVRTDLEAISIAEKPWARCNLDGLITLPSGDHGVLECKTASDSRAWGEAGSGDVPPEYFCQVQWNMLVSDLHFADIPVLFFDQGKHVEIYFVEANPHFQEWMLETVRIFWTHVQSGSPPSPTSGGEAERLWPTHKKGVEKMADEEICLQIEQLKALKAEAKQTAEAIKQIESVVKVVFEDCESIVDGDRTLATWKATTTKRLDTTKLREQHKNLCEEFTKTTTSRRLIIK